VDRRMGGTQSHSGHGGEEKNSRPLPGIKPVTVVPKWNPYLPSLRFASPSLRTKAEIVTSVKGTETTN